MTEGSLGPARTPLGEKLLEARRRIAELAERTLDEQVADIRAECSAPGWDGYDAAPVSEDALAQALRVLDALPEEMRRLVDLGACPDGDAMLSWAIGESVIDANCDGGQVAVCCGGAVRELHAAHVQGRQHKGLFESESEAAGWLAEILLDADALDAVGY